MLRSLTCSIGFFNTDKTVLPPPLPSTIPDGPVLEIEEPEINARSGRLQRDAKGLAVFGRPGRPNASRTVLSRNIEVTSNPVSLSCVGAEAKPNW
jgi:hypothetical protein